VCVCFSLKSICDVRFFTDKEDNETKKKKRIFF